MFEGLRENSVRDWDRRYEGNIFYSLNSRTDNEACPDLFHIFQGLPLSRRPFGSYSRICFCPLSPVFLFKRFVQVVMVISLSLYHWNFPFYPPSFAIRFKRNFTDVLNNVETYKKKLVTKRAVI